MQCKASSIPWMVIIKDKTYHTGGLLRIKNVEKRTESQITRAELGDYMLQLVKIPKGNVEAMYFSPSQRESSSQNYGNAQSSSHATQPSLDILITNQDNIGNSKTLRRIANMATLKIMPTLKKLTSQAVTKVLVVDAPVYILKEVASMFDTTNDSLPILDKYPRYRDQLQHLVPILSKHKNFPLVFLYNYKEDNFVTMVNPL